ncbi:MAG: hypothetical protein E7635_05645 [Ruminococcaceae bacterium]|nr:hypothetical protein [Oscillospiraceae bacterium]
MTSNTYNKVKKKKNIISEADAKVVAKRGALVHTGSDSARKKTNTVTQAPAVARRREKVTTKPQALHTRIPAILGFDTRDKFNTIAVSTANRYPLVIGLLTTLLITSMFMLVVVNAVSINKMKLETTQMNSELEKLIEREDELTLELEKRDDLRYIREIAVNQYGMIDKKHATKHYISLDKEDKVEVLNKADSEPVVGGASD